MPKAKSQTRAAPATLSRRVEKLVNEVGIRNYAKATKQTQKAVREIIERPSRALRSQRARDQAAGLVRDFQKRPDYKEFKQHSEQGRNLADKIKRSKIRPTELASRIDSNFQKVEKAIERMSKGGATSGDLKTLETAYNDLTKDTPTLIQIGTGPADYTFCFHGQAQLDGLGIEYDRRAAPYRNLAEATDKLVTVVGPGFRYFAILEYDDPDIPGGKLYNLVFFPEIQSEETSIAEVASNLTEGISPLAVPEEEVDSGE